MLDIGQGFLSPSGARLGQFALQNAVSIGQAPQLGEKRFMVGAPGGLGRRLGEKKTTESSQAFLGKV
jgi:hypothetical protein